MSGCGMIVTTAGPRPQGCPVTVWTPGVQAVDNRSVVHRTTSL